MGNCCASERAVNSSYGPIAQQVPRSRMKQPSTAEKRSRAAEAAERRQQTWKQTGNVSTDPVLKEKRQERQLKEVWLGKIEAFYQVKKGQDAPIGLGSYSYEQLRKHWDKLQQEDKLK